MPDKSYYNYIHVEIINTKWCYYVQTSNYDMTQTRNGRHFDTVHESFLVCNIPYFFSLFTFFMFSCEGKTYPIYFNIWLNCIFVAVALDFKNVNER